MARSGGRAAGHGRCARRGPLVRPDQGRQQRRGRVADSERGREQRRSPELGLGGPALPACRRRLLRGRRQEDVRAAAVPVHQQPHLQRRRAEPLLRERRLPVGLGLGPVPGSHVRPAQREAGREGADPVRLEGPAGAVPKRPRPDRVLPHACGTWHGRRDRAPTGDQHRPELHRRLRRVRRLGQPARVAAQGAGRRKHGEQQRLAASAGRVSPANDRAGKGRRRTPDGSDGRRWRTPGERGCRRGRAREREHRAHGHAHALRARAQPDRLPPAGHALGGGPLPDRAARRRRRAAVHHLHAVPPGARGRPSALSRVRRRT